MTSPKMICPTFLVSAVNRDIFLAFAKWCHSSHFAQSHTIIKHTNGLYVIVQPSE